VSDYALDTLILTVLWAGLGGAWNLFCGYVRKDSIGHAAFFGVGAYTSTLMLLRLGISPWLGMLVGAVLAATAALVIGAITLRLRGPFFTLATIAFAEVLRTLAVGLRGLTEGSVGLTIHTATGLRLMRFDSKAAYLLVALGLLALVVAVTYWQSRSRFGYLLRAMGEDEDVAGTLGVNTLPLKLGSLGVSAALTGMLGTFYAQYITFIDPDSAFNIFDSIQMALVAILGGVGTLLGPLLGALLMVPLGVWLRGLLGAQMAGLHLVIYAVILIAAALFMPQGIMGALDVRGLRLRARKAALAAGPEPR
jgi:branched-chain amino acid transport system permease protein